MTLLEKAKEMGLTIKQTSSGEEYAEMCPFIHGLESEEESMTFCSGHDCPECYAREYKEPKTVTPAVPEKTTEDMRHFSTGAVRDSAVGKGRYDLMPFAAIHALAQHCERGALHYGERNVDKGIPQHSLIDSAIRHLGQYIQGDAEDYHLVAALWNIAWACEQEAKRPEMIDLPERTEKSGKAI